MKNRIARTKAILDLAQLAQSENSIGVLLAAGGPNGVISAGCASILNMHYTIYGEDPRRGRCIMSAPKVKAIYDLRHILSTPDLAGLDAGSVIVIEMENVEEGANFIRNSLASPSLLPFLVTTCHRISETNLGKAA